jgi:hypothetical protein
VSKRGLYGEFSKIIRQDRLQMQNRQGVKAGLHDDCKVGFFRFSAAFFNHFSF